MTEPTTAAPEPVRLRLGRPYAGLLVSFFLVVFAVLAGGIALTVVLGDGDALPRALVGVVGGGFAAGFLVALWAIWHKQVILDGRRIGWSTGLRRPRVWMRTDRVVLALARQVQGQHGPQRGLVLFAPEGGHGRLAGRMCRMGLTREDKQRLTESEASIGSGLRALYLPVSEMRRPEAAALHSHLEATLPPALGAHAARVVTWATR